MKPTPTRLAAAIALALAPLASGAQPSSASPAASAAGQTLAPVEIRGTRERTMQSLSDAPAAMPAQTDTITRERVEAQSFSTATDLLRSTPGVTFGSSSPGGDIGTDISIRGFNGFHGSQTAIYIDGMPINWSHSRYGAHGLADLEWLTPEMIERIEVVKGPFSALYGNFNLAGAINIVTRTSDPSSVAIEGGTERRARATAVFSSTTGTGATPFLLLDSSYRHGHRDRDDYRRQNAFGKWTVPLGDGRLSLRLNGSVRDFNSGGFLLAEDVRAGTVDRRSASPDSGGDRGRLGTLTALVNYAPTSDRLPAATVYLSRETQRLADTSFGPPQAYLASQRTVGGLRVTQSFRFGERALLTAGVEAQATRVQNRNADTDGSGNPTVDTVRSDVAEQSAGVFAQGQFKVVDTVKLVGGLRYDRFRTDVDNILFPNSSGRASTGRASPKVGAVWTPLAWLDVFANHGTGFRSPSAGERSPDSATGTFNGSLGVLRLKSSDVGLTLRPLPGLKITGAYFDTDTEGELRRDPSAPAVFVNLGATERKGFEVVGEWAIGERWFASASHTKVDTRIGNPPNPANTLVITVPRSVQTAALSYKGPRGGPLGFAWSGDVFLQRTGERPLAANGSFPSEPRNAVGGKVRVASGRWSGFVQVDWRPDRYSSDFVYAIGGTAYDPQPVLAGLVGVRYAFE